MQSDQERLDSLMRKAREFSEGQVLELEKKVTTLRAKINVLLDERATVLNSPYTVTEVLEVAKKALEDGRREHYIKGLLIPHLQKIQQRKDNPLVPACVRLDFISDLHHFKLVYNMIDETDLIEASKALDNIGMPRAEREAKVAGINSKVKALETEIERLLS